jgi:integrase
VLSHMFTFALKKRLIGAHPRTRYGRLRENEKALRVMTLEEVRRLVEKVMDENMMIGCYVGLLGEADLRKSEGLRLNWDYVDTERRTLTVEASKNGKARYVPLSDYALELLGKLPRTDKCPFVFVLARHEAAGSRSSSLVLRGSLERGIRVGRFSRPATF